MILYKHCYIVVCFVSQLIFFYVAVFKFSDVNFKDIDDVPITLIKSVALNFRRKKFVCRVCFFGERDLCEKDDGEMCSSGEHKWIKPVVVIPGKLNSNQANMCSSTCRMKMLILILFSLVFKLSSFLFYLFIFFIFFFPLHFSLSLSLFFYFLFFFPSLKLRKSCHFVYSHHYRVYSV